MHACWGHNLRACKLDKLVSARDVALALRIALHPANLNSHEPNSPGYSVRFSSATLLVPLVPLLVYLLVVFVGHRARKPTHRMYSP